MRAEKMMNVMMNEKVRIEVCSFMICDFFFFLGEACSREGGEMGKVELVGLVEVVVFWGGGFGVWVWV